jgi:hypothetical protein
MGRAAAGRVDAKRRTVVNNPVRGALIASAVAGLLFGGQALAAEPAGGGEAAKVKCVGGNECKGKSACGTAESSCAGQNSCKGKGWIMTSEADCKAKGGKVAK